MGMYSIQDYVIYIPILFAILFIFLKIFRRMKLDWRFLVLLPPYILIGISIRLLADTGAIKADQLYSVTPGVYIVSITLGLILISLGFLVKRLTGLDYWILPFISGSVISLILVYRLTTYLTNPGWISYPILLAVFITLAVYSLAILLKIGIFKKASNLGIIYAHLLDGSATYLALNNYPYFYEEHLLPDYLISLTGNAFIMIPLKLSIILLTLYFIEKWYLEEEKADKSLYTLIKIVIFIIGFGPGIRNTLLPALKL
ncbi:MAG: DUF63 family protein [Candidatus Altiarchaeota archaeon]|nr:DUF63 family protein [Candidatus Altiarchaeota archaeon]